MSAEPQEPAAPPRVHRGDGAALVTVDDYSPAGGGYAADLRGDLVGLLRDNGATSKDEALELLREYDEAMYYWRIEQANR